MCRELAVFHLKQSKQTGHHASNGTGYRLVTSQGARRSNKHNSVTGTLSDVSESLNTLNSPKRHDTGRLNLDPNIIVHTVSTYYTFDNDIKSLKASH